MLMYYKTADMFYHSQSHSLQHALCHFGVYFFFSRSPLSANDFMFILSSGFLYYAVHKAYMLFMELKRLNNVLDTKLRAFISSIWPYSIQTNKNRRISQLSQLHMVHKNEHE